MRNARRKIKVIGTALGVLLLASALGIVIYNNSKKEPVLTQLQSEEPMARPIDESLKSQTFHNVWQSLQRASQSSPDLADGAFLRLQQFLKLKPEAIPELANELKSTRTRTRLWILGLSALVREGSEESQMAIIELIQVLPTQADSAAALVELSKVEIPSLATIQTCYELSDWQEENYIAKDERNIIRKACGFMAGRLADRVSAEKLIERPLILVEYPKRVPTDDLVEAIEVVGNSRWAPAVSKLLTLIEKDEKVEEKPKNETSEEEPTQNEVQLRRERINGAVVFALRFMESEAAGEQLLLETKNSDADIQHIAQQAIELRCRFLPKACQGELANFKKE